MHAAGFPAVSYHRPFGPAHLGAIHQWTNLALARRIGHVAWGYWVLPTLLFLSGVGVMVAKIDPLSALVGIIGWLLVVYGLTECVNGMKVYSLRRAATKRQKEAEQKQAETEPTIAETIEHDPTPLPEQTGA